MAYGVFRVLFCDPTSPPSSSSLSFQIRLVTDPKPFRPVSFLETLPIEFLKMARNPVTPLQINGPWIGTLLNPGPCTEP